MNDPVPAPSTDADYSGVAFQPIYTAHVTVSGRDPADGGYRLQVDLVVNWPGADHETAARLLAEATALCPYAKMVRQGAPATITLAH